MSFLYCGGSTPCITARRRSTFSSTPAAIRSISCSLGSAGWSCCSRPALRRRWGRTPASFRRWFCSWAQCGASSSTPTCACGSALVEEIISTPAFHHWHHTYEDHKDHNYAPMLPFIDRLFGTFYLPKTWPAEYGTSTPVAESLIGQIVDPFAPGPAAQRRPSAAPKARNPPRNPCGAEVRGRLPCPERNRVLREQLRSGLFGRAFLTRSLESTPGRRFRC